MRSSYSGSVIGPKMSTCTLPRMFMPAPWITRTLGIVLSVRTGIVRILPARGLRAAVDGDGAALEHQLDAGGVEQHVDVVERVAVHDDEVGEPALLDRADLALECQAPGGPLGARAQGLHGREPGGGQAAELGRVLRVAVAAGVG